MMNARKNIYYSIILILILILFFLINISYSVPDQSESSPSTDLFKTTKIPDSIVSISSGYVIVVDKTYQKIYVFHKTDKRAGRNGSNIWIHGTTESLLPKQSKGCVVLRDNDLKRLANFIFLNKTPVIISESLNWVPQDYVPSSKNELENILTSWNKAFIEKDIEKIDSLYMQGTEIKGKRREELHDKIKNLKLINRHFVLEPRDISILQDGDNAVIIFDQIFSVTGNNTFQGFYNKLILEKINQKWYVVDDVTPSGTTDPKTVLAKNTPQERKETGNIDQQQIQKVVKKWLISWQSGDMAAYRNCYAQNFQSKDMNLDKWIDHKTQDRQNSKNIKISIERLKISANGENATATFIQHYTSSTLKSKGQKSLHLKKTGKEWKIHREIM